MSERDLVDGPSIDMSRHVVPAGVLVTAIIGALLGWWQLEGKIDERIEAKVKPIKAELSRMEQGQQKGMGEIKETLVKMSEELQRVRESLARLEGVR